jgi:hypothetical protein
LVIPAIGASTTGGSTSNLGVCKDIGKTILRR